MIVSRAQKTKESTACCLPFCGYTKKKSRKARKRSVSMSVVPIKPQPLPFERSRNLQPRVLQLKSHQFGSDKSQASQNGGEKDNRSEDQKVNDKGRRQSDNVHERNKQKIEIDELINDQRKNSLGKPEQISFGSSSFLKAEKRLSKKHLEHLNLNNENDSVSANLD